MSEVPASRPSDYRLQPGETWFVVRTLHHRESVAEQNLVNQGFRVFIPRFEKTIRHARKFRKVLAPLFPGYGFVILNLERDRWRSINGTFGVSYLMVAEERPMAVPDGVVDALLARSNGRLVSFDDDLSEGDAVRILSGPFAQHIGKLTRLGDKARVEVLMEIMGAKLPVTISRSVLQKA